MVLVGVVRVVLLLSVVLMWWATVSEAQITREVLANMVQVIRNRYRINGEYAIAFNIPEQQCKHNPDNNFLQRDTDREVNAALDLGIVYKGKQLIAAKPLHYMENGVRLTDHAEYRLLVSPDEDEKNSPMHYLLGKQLRNGCLVFFSTFSPCVEKCANLRHPYSILAHLSVFNFWKEEWTAFAFYDVFDYDKYHRSRNDVLNSLIAIHNGAKIPIFRCNRYMNQNHCYDCMEDRNPRTNQCLYGMPQ